MEDRKDFIEQILGGIFGIIAVAAAVCEMYLSGINAASIAGCVKDAFGTMAIIVLFFAIIKDSIPKAKFVDRLEAALNEWQENNSNMIVRNPEHDLGENQQMFYSLDLKTNVEDFYKNGNHKKTGVFVRMPELTNKNYRESKPELTFTLNKSTFFEGVPDTELTAEDFLTLATMFSALVSSKHPKLVGTLLPSATNGRGKIVISLEHSIKTKSDIYEFVDLLNTMYTAYLVSARITVKKK